MMRRNVDIDFTLALNNRTGKYFICRDLIENSRDLINKTRYWRFYASGEPTKLWARILGRLALYDILIRRDSAAARRSLPKVSSSRPVVYTDPREVIYGDLKPYDVVLCHDMGPITHPELYATGVSESYAFSFDKIATVKPLMLFVSKASRAAFVKLYGSDYPLLEVMYPPIRTGAADGGSVSPPGISEPFFLTVGCAGTRKNQIRSIEAFARSGLADQGYSYVLCGGPEPGYEKVAELAGKTPGVRMMGYRRDVELRWLYQHAAGFILPSLLEGFGLPAAEAIVHGLIPLVSRDSALHEVVGESGVLVDPLSVDSIVNGMRDLVSLTRAEKTARLASLSQHIGQFTDEAARSVWRKTLQKAIAMQNPAGIFN